MAPNSVGDVDKRWTRWTIGVLLLLSTTGCGPDASRSEPIVAVAQIAATRGNRATGVVTFTEVAGGVRVVAALVGVSAGAHGFHLHEFGDCGSSDGASAGGHWNPEGVIHAGRLAPVRHVGDLGNVLGDADRVATADFVDTVLAFGGPRSILGKAVIVHADEDDLTSQPSGAAGARIACGVIEPLSASGHRGGAE